MMKKSWTLINDSATTVLLLHESVRSIVDMHYLKM